MTLMSSEIAQFIIPLPDKATQQEIAAGIETVERKHGQHQRKHAALTVLFRTLLHQLMTAQLRVHDLDLPRLLEDAQTHDRPKSSATLMSRGATE